MKNAYNPHKKAGQAATEFMLFVGAGIFLLLLFTLIASFYLRFNTVQQDELTAQDLGNYLKDEINLAAMVENGYSRTIAIPNQLDGQDYSLYIGDTAIAGGKTGKRELLVEYAGNEYVESLAVDINSGMSITGANKRDTITHVDQGGKFDSGNFAVQLSLDFYGSSGYKIISEDITSILNQHISNIRRLLKAL